jgi:hypothetical protein
MASFPSALHSLVQSDLIDLPFPPTNPSGHLRVFAMTSIHYALFLSISHPGSPGLLLADYLLPFLFHQGDEARRSGRELYSSATAVGSLD